MNNKSKMIRVPYAVSAHGKEEAVAVARVINEHRTNLGREVRTFEAQVAKIFGKKFGVMVNSGSSANLLAFEVLDLPPGSEVITPALTFSTTVAPIIQKGLVPVFVDVEQGTLLADVCQIEKKITKKTRALMIPALIGNIPQWDKFAHIAKQYNLFLIEDSCDTIGAKYKGKPTGTYSHISTTSFFGSHVINAAGGGGMVMVNDLLWAKRLAVLRGWGRSSALFSESEDLNMRFATRFAGVPYDGKFLFTEIAYNFLPLEISAAFGIVQLKKLPRFTRMRQKNFKILFDFFSAFPQYFNLPHQTTGSSTNWLAFPLTIKTEAPFSRLELTIFLERHNIQTRPVFTGNILRQPILSGKPPEVDSAMYAHYTVSISAMHKSIVTRLANSAQMSNFPVADFIMRQSLLIGCHQNLNRQHIAHIKNVFKKFIEMHGSTTRLT